MGLYWGYAGVMVWLLCGYRSRSSNRVSVDLDWGLREGYNGVTLDLMVGLR